MQKIAILILAAGSSSRMGEPKQLLPYKHTTLLGWVIEQAKNSIANDVFCVLGANVETIKQKIEKSNCKIIYNPNFKEGLSSSIVIGIKQLEPGNFDSALIMLADQPNVNSKYLNELIKTSEENPLKIIASNYGKKVGVPAVFPKHYFNQLTRLKGDKGASNLLNSIDNCIILNTTNLVDIDTPEDYKKVRN